jgi:hypothetical protein
MNRRTAIRNVIVISAGAGLLPSCMNEDKSAISLKNISVTGSQEKMLAELAETIIPKTKNFIGANDLKAHEFLLTMVDECTSPEDQQKFMEGLKQFGETCKKEYGASFVKSSAGQRKELLSAIESKKGIPEEVLKFYGTVKRYTVQSFTSSKEYMTGIRKYNMVPGSNFKGCVPAF